MINANFENIITHGGNFHADDVFSVAILKYLYPKANVFRTRDISFMEEVANNKSNNIFVDVGNKYIVGNFGNVYLDHHMMDLRLEKTDNSLPFNKKTSFDVLLKIVFNTLSENKTIFSNNDINKLTQKIKSEITPVFTESLIKYCNGDELSPIWINYKNIITIINNCVNNGYVKSINNYDYKSDIFNISTIFDKTICSNLKTSLHNNFKFRKYSGFGLTWLYFGKLFISNILSSISSNSENRQTEDEINDIFKFVDKRLVLPIDLNDNGIQSYTGTSFDILDVIQSYNSSNIKSEDQFTQFMKAVDFSSGFLEMFIKREYLSYKKGKELFFISYKKGEKIQHFTDYIPKIEKLLYTIKDSDTEYFTFPSDNGVKIMTLKNGGYENKKDLPVNWLNKDGNGKYTTKGLNFVHQSLFIAEFDSLESLEEAMI